MPKIDFTAEEMKFLDNMIRELQDNSASFDANDNPELTRSIFAKLKLPK